MEDRQVVVFRIGSEHYAIPIMRVNEIVRMQKVTHVPDAAAFIKGITNLRGKIIPVVDFRERFGLVAEATDEQTRIIVVSAGGSAIGLIVDAVTEVLTVKGEDIETAGGIGFGVDARYIDGVAKVGDDLVVLLDLDKVFSAGEQGDFSRIA